MTLKERMMKRNQYESLLGIDLGRISFESIMVLINKVGEEIRTKRGNRSIYQAILDRDIISR